MSATKSNLDKFTVRPTQEAKASTAPQGERITVTRGKESRVGIAVRLDKEDWYRVHEYALRQGTSIQRLIVASLSDHMEKNGLPPLSGK
ncbi:MAG: hypothetical protein ACP5E5_15245 [Acidobacteriaceae bacterium]